MKHLVLTGIASELDIQSGRTSYSLVFNEGELHLPVQEDAVEAALSAMVSEDVEPTKMSSSEELAHEKELMRQDRETSEQPIDWAHSPEQQAENAAYVGGFHVQSAGEHVDSDRVVPYQEVSPGPSEEDIAAVVAQSQGWQSSNGQLPLDQSDQGADIFSATDDYAQPPTVSSSVEDINDGVASI